MISINNKNYIEEIECINFPPYDLTVPKDKVTERKLEPPTDELMYLETPFGDIFFNLS